MRCPVCEHDNRAGARFCDECGARLEPAAAAGSTMPAAVGDGRYRVERLLGEGVRKRVYAAVDTRLDRDVAVAVVKTEGLDDAGRHRIEREARAMARLGDHPNIVTVFDVGEDDGTPHIVSQLMPGGSIAEVLAGAEGHRIGVDEALRIVSEIARALAHAHGLGIVHRDLKPANVWLADDGSAKLGDFGLAAPVDQSRITAEGMVVGTVAYLAPEQALGQPPEGQADLYSLGALLYELLTGRPPFLGDDPVAVISQHLNSAPVAPSWHNAAVPPAVEALTMRLLAKKPTDRPTDAAEVAAEVERIREASSEPITTAPVELRPDARVAEWGRFVGRTGELDELRAALDDALSGHGRLVMIVGEPGIGKTRLSEELTTHGALRGAQVCWGRSYEGELGVPYLPFVEAFRAYVRERADDELRKELSTGAPEVATLVSDLRERFPELPESPPLEGDAERLRLFDGVTTFLQNATAAQPIVLVLDDLHWADKPSLLLLQYLARNLRHHRILIVGTYRDVELDRAHPLADAVANLRREQLYQRVLLRGLPRDEVKALIEAVGDQEPDDRFADVVHRETEGNPFFVAEILRHLVETGGLQRVEGRWVGTPESVAANLPEGVREVIGRRLDHLSDDCNQMLGVAGAMAGGFTVDVVSAVTGLGEDHTLDLLDEALAAQIVQERKDAPGVYEFTHALIRQTLYGELNTPRRVRMHREILTALEHRHGGHAEPHLATLAYHAFQAAPGGDVDKAVDYATRAGDQACARVAHEEAARYYDLAVQALDLHDQPDPRRKAELLIALGSARSRAGETEDAEAALRDAVGLARQLRVPALLARAALAFSSLRWAAAYQPEAIALLDEAAVELGESDPVLRARLLARESRFLGFHDLQKSAALATQAVKAGRQAGDPGALAYALGALSFHLFSQERFDEYAAGRAEMARLAEEAGDHELAILTSQNRLADALNDGRRDEYDFEIETLDRLANESRSPFHIANALTARAERAAIDGDFDEAERLAAAVLEHGRRLRDPGLISLFGVAVFAPWREQGRLARLEGSTARAVTEQTTITAWRAGLAIVLMETGKLHQAREHLDVLAEDGFSRIPEDAFHRWALAACAEVTVAVGDTERAETLLGLLEPLADKFVTLGMTAYHGAVARYLGLLALLLGRVDDAIARHEIALDMHARFRARPWVARSRYDLAGALVARGAPGDRQRAVGLLNEALDVANEIGMARLIEQALELKLQLQGIDASSSPQLSIDAVAAAVSVERPDLRDHAADDGQVTLVFTDIEGYSELTERLGDRRTQDVLRAHGEIVSRAVAAHSGTIVKTQGDGCMMVFPQPAAALACTMAIRDAIDAHAFGADVGPLRVRMGVHAGEAIREGDDFFGRTVIVASRVACAASGGDILVTDAVRSAAEDGFGFDAGRELTLKGLRGSHRVFMLTGPR